MPFVTDALTGVLTAVQKALGYTPVNKAGDTMTGALVIKGPDQSTTNALTIYDSGGSNVILNARDNQTVAIGAASDPDSWARFYVANGGFRCDDDFRFKKGSGSQYFTRFGGTGYDLQFQCQGNQFIMYGIGGSAFQQSITYPIASKTSNYGPGFGDHTIIASGVGTTITLPDATLRAGIKFIIKRVDASNAITVNTTNSQTIDGVTSLPLSANYEAITVQSDASNWQVIGQVATTIL